MAENWQTPYVSWSSEVISDTAMNRIEGNINSLGAGGGRSALVSATAAVSLTLPNSTDDVFELDLDSTTISYISAANRQYGNKITLIGVTGTYGFTTLLHNTGAPGAGFYNIFEADSANYDLYTMEAVTLTFSQYGWHLNHS